MPCRASGSRERRPRREDPGDSAGTGARRRRQPSRTSSPEWQPWWRAFPCRSSWLFPPQDNQAELGEALRLSLGQGPPHRAVRGVAIGAELPRSAARRQRNDRQAIAPCLRGESWPARPTRQKPPLLKGLGRRTAARHPDRVRPAGGRRSDPNPARPPARPAVAGGDWPPQAGCQNGPAS